MSVLSTAVLRDRFQLHANGLLLFGVPEGAATLALFDADIPRTFVHPDQSHATKSRRTPDTTSATPLDRSDTPDAQPGYNLLIINSEFLHSDTLLKIDEYLPNADAAIAEIYADAFHAAIDELDLYFFDHGLLRVFTNEPEAAASPRTVMYLRSAFIADLACLRQPRLHQVTMPDLGTNGRFANQIWQYIFIMLYGLRSNSNVLIPEFEGHKFFDLPFQAGRKKRLPRLNFRQNHADAEVIMEASNPPRNVELCGFFQHITRAHRLHRPIIQKMLTPKSPTGEMLANWLAEVRSRFPRLIGLHIRRGDYVPYDGSNWTPFSQVPVEWYRDWLVQHANMGPDDGLFISTDDPSVNKQFGCFNIVHDCIPLPPGLDPRMADLYGLGACDIALYCNSSWSFLAALLADDSQRAFLVNVQGRTFVPFAAWASQDFWKPFEPIRPLDARPLRSSDRATIEQRFLDHWKNEAELSFCLNFPGRYLLHRIWRRWAGSLVTRKLSRILAPERSRQNWQIVSERALLQRRTIRGILAGRPVRAREFFNQSKK